MKVLKSRNVNEALQKGILALKDEGREVSPRGIRTLEIKCPVTTVLRYPRERVLFNPVRNVNPFFHLMESLWILAGRKDVKVLSLFNKHVNQFSDNGSEFHGAYGHRLRNHFLDSYYIRPIDGLTEPGMEVDQFEEIIALFKKDPDTRQGVLQIYDPAYDLNIRAKDIPCNTAAYLKIRDEKLNITVCNRSNDIIWGLYGTDIVQFSMIQEYIASMLEVEVGSYTHVSDSFHAYVDRPDYGKLLYHYLSEDICDPYESLGVRPMAMVFNKSTWESELLEIMNHLDYGMGSNPYQRSILRGSFKNPFFSDLVLPMLELWFFHKKWLEIGHPVNVADPSSYFPPYIIDARVDWAISAINWIHRRRNSVWGLSL